MAWYVYKCNDSSNPYKDAKLTEVGEDAWKFFFDGKSDGSWGDTIRVKQLDILQPGDMCLAYQTERNELVGLVKMTGRKAQRILFEAIETFGVKVRPLKKDPAVACIPAFQPGEKKTLYDISEADAQNIMEAARKVLVASGR